MSIPLPICIFEWATCLSCQKCFKQGVWVLGWFALHLSTVIHETKAHQHKRCLKFERVRRVDYKVTDFQQRKC